MTKDEMQKIIDAYNRLTEVQLEEFESSIWGKTNVARITKSDFETLKPFIDAEVTTTYKFSGVEFSLKRQGVRERSDLIFLNDEYCLLSIKNSLEFGVMIKHLYEMISMLEFHRKRIKSNVLYGEVEEE